MPFIGQDWRSPGDQWVKTAEGWEKLKMWRLKLLDNLNDNIIARLLKLTNDYDNMMVYKDRNHGTQPHVLLLRNSTRERKAQSCLGETLYRLDLIGAVKDGRRFNYTSKLMELLIQEHFSQLSVSAQKTILNILEEMLNQVLKQQNNVHVAQRLINLTRAELHRSRYNHLGSDGLWRKHHDSLDKMQAKLDALQIKERSEDGGATLHDLPPELVREILLRLADGGDVARAGMTSPDNALAALAADTALWRDLCLVHFTPRQMVAVLRKGETLDNIGWKEMYKRLVKRYGLKDLFAEMLHLCRHCNALFWKCHGHPCFAHNMKPESLPMTPAMCVQLFAI